MAHTELRRMETVYFAQQRDGGPIKIGITRYGASRVTMLGGAFPHGADLLASVSGHRLREAYLHLVFADARLGGEWFKSCIPVWRAIIEAADTGDISWLPSEADLSWSPAECRRRMALLGWRPKDAAKHMGISQGALSARLNNTQPSSGLIAAIALEENRRRGIVPPHLRTG